MKIVFIGCVVFSARSLRQLLELGAEVVGVVTRERSGFNADFEDLSGVAAEFGVPVCYADDINAPTVVDWISSRGPDLICCWGWSSLIKEQLLTLPPLGVLGFHPAALPQNRGRHPLIWALALGLKQTASTFFFMDSGADSGDILSQVEIPVAYEDNAETLYTKVTDAALQQIVEFLPALQNGTYRRRKQQHDRANYWRKRGPKDGLIDFRMSSRTIYNLVRALSEPYVGAHMLCGDMEVKVWAVREEKLSSPNLEPGKVLAVEGCEVLVKCGEQGVWLCRHELPQLPAIGDYL